MKGVNSLKAPFGAGKFSRLRNVSFRQWDEMFEVEFEDGLSFLEPHQTIREANRIASNAKIEKVQLDEELRHGFLVIQCTPNRVRNRRICHEHPDRNWCLSRCDDPTRVDKIAVEVFLTGQLDVDLLIRQCAGARLVLGSASFDIGEVMR